ncbi:MAG TPA: hypothetical protein VLA90_12505, partial [Actinomycetota bacterium]|nr:hypothetical protein [Actinomycetota bacterium]
MALPVRQPDPRTAETADPAAAAVRGRFEAVVFDWEGTAIPDRSADAGPVRTLVEDLSAEGLDLFVVAGTDVRGVDGQLGARPAGPGELHLLLNHGSEVFRVDRRGPHLLERRTATEDENRALDLAASRAVESLVEHGLLARLVPHGLNRRRIALRPDPEGAKPVAPVAEPLETIERHLASVGIAGLPDVVAIAEDAARGVGAELRIRADLSHVEIGLTDRSDSARWVVSALARLGVPPERVLMAGDEFGAVGGVPGDDALMLVPEAEGAVVVSVGDEPGGVPEGVAALGGGPPAFLALLEDQLARRLRGDLPEPLLDPTWTVSVDGIDPRLERVHESLLTLADGRVGTSGSPLVLHPAATPRVVASGIYEPPDSDGGLLSCPAWAQLSLWVDEEEDEHGRVLDLRSGLLYEDARTQEVAVRSVRFASLARPGLGVLRAQSSPAQVPAAPAPSLPPGLAGEQGRLDGIPWARLEAAEGGVATAVTDQERHAEGWDV